jgi:MOSC domain-containing protein YiiM
MTPGPGRIVGIFLSPRHGLAMKPQPEATVRENHGLDGDAHARPGSPRQVLLLESETLEELGVAPGALKENILTEGIRVAGLRSGTRLRAGEALLEVTMDCSPCAWVESVQPGLREKIRGRRGTLARVVASGPIRLGDPISLMTD